ncbi:MAG TPA: QueT transporter family protein [Candidatus Sulfotelmatobacter sp.]|nr:QueT transporter family protein [Candidatus Sulfotelmatobacter sp.]
MRELFTMWRHTKMVVLVALTAAVYAAILIPLKGIPLIPGITELRPANAVPVVFSLLFGPAAAWGAAFGNLIADFFGTLGLGSLFGFVGNFFYGLIPYKLWGKMGPLSVPGGLEVRSGRQVVEYLLSALLASGVCAAVIAWGVDLFGLVPFGFLGPIIALNNFAAAAVLGPFLLWLLYPRAKRWDILWTEILEADDVSLARRPWVGVTLMWVGGMGALAAGLVLSTGMRATNVTVGLGVLPFLALFLLGCLLA